MKTKNTFTLIGIIALVAAAFFSAACSGTFIDPGHDDIGGDYSDNNGDDHKGSGSNSGYGSGNSKGGESLAGTYTRSVGTYVTYTLEFTNTTYSLKTGEMTTLSGSYKYGGTTLTLNINSVDIKGSANLSGSSLTLSEFGAYALSFDGTWTRQ
ncbi:MAG: hypothetical protein LBC57_04710 [Treponema sp.]|jgi:hypothetical protein|nr:hypothetical protein [Treponema sp.]